MKAVEQKQNQAVYVEESNFERPDSINCFQVRAKLETLFGGKSSLEEMPPDMKRILFRHLEHCRSCCRSFDVRVHFQPTLRAHL